MVLVSWWYERIESRAMRAEYALGTDVLGAIGGMLCFSVASIVGDKFPCSIACTATMSWNGLIDGSVVNFAYHEACNGDPTAALATVIRQQWRRKL